MARCGNCGALLVTAGSQRGDVAYCNERCAADAHWGEYAAWHVPEAAVDDAAQAIRAAACPVCHSPGPVDAYPMSFHFSAFVISVSHREVLLACARCAAARHRTNMILTALLGWWSIIGWILTPIVLYRAWKAPVVEHPSPSPRLRALVRRWLAERVARLAPGASVGHAQIIMGINIGRAPQMPPG
jgi:hypothetical protein